LGFNQEARTTFQVVVGGQVVSQYSKGKIMKLSSGIFVGVITLSAVTSAHSEISVIKASFGISDLAMSATSLNPALQLNPAFTSRFPNDGLILNARTSRSPGGGRVDNEHNAGLFIPGAPFDASSGSAALPGNLASITKTGNSTQIDFDIPVSSFQGQSYGMFRGNPTGGTSLSADFERTGGGWNLSPYSSVTITGVLHGQVSAQPGAVVGLTGGNTLVLGASAMFSIGGAPTLDATPEQADIANFDGVFTTLASDHYVSDSGVLFSDGTKTLDQPFSITFKNPTGTDMLVAFNFRLSTFAGWNPSLTTPVPELNVSLMWLMGMAGLYGVGRKRASLGQKA
jgi:hypothetical protein